MASKATPATEATIVLEPMEMTTLTVEVKGTAPLITNAWSRKAKQQMLEGQTGVKKVKQHKNPTADYEDSIYHLSDGRYGFPTTAFKLATVSGGRFFKGAVTMAALKPLLYFAPDDPASNLTAINGGPPTPREDMVRLEGRKADIRYRAQYLDWSAILRVEFASHMISEDSVLALMNAGGKVGVGEWRPEKNGTFGTYEIVAVAS